MKKNPPKPAPSASAAHPEARIKFKSVSSAHGEHGRPGADPVVADLHASSFTEGVRTPYGTNPTKPTTNRKD